MKKLLLRLLTKLLTYYSITVGVIGMIAFFWIMFKFYHNYNLNDVCDQRCKTEARAVAGETLPQMNHDVCICFYKKGHTYLFHERD